MKRPWEYDKKEFKSNLSMSLGKCMAEQVLGRLTIKQYLLRAKKEMSLWRVMMPKDMKRQTWKTEEVDLSFVLSCSAP